MSSDYKLTFGKYKGETLEEIYIEDVGYLDWLQESIEKGSYRGANGKDLLEKIENCFKEMRTKRIY